MEQYEILDEYNDVERNEKELHTFLFNVARDLTRHMNTFNNRSYYDQRYGICKVLSCYPTTAVRSGEEWYTFILSIVKAKIYEADDLVEEEKILSFDLFKKNFEKEKFITKFVDPSDGRRINLKLTLLGEDTLKKVAPDMDLVYKAIQKRYGEDKLKLLLDLLGEIGQWRGR